MIRVAVVDDDPAVQKKLNAYLNKYQEENGERFSVAFYGDASEIVRDYRPVYDIIFMDIQMPEMDGMTGAEKIRQVDEDVVIIFVTNMAGFAIKGYRVNAMSYVLKPILYVDFVQQLNRVVRRLDYKKKAFILVTVNGEILRLDISRICYMEKNEHKVMIKMETETLLINSSIKKLEQEVSGYHFARCNSGYLVSLSHVQGIEKDMVKVNGELLPISRPRKKAFMNALSEYIGGEYR